MRLTVLTLTGLLAATQTLAQTCYGSGAEFQTDIESLRFIFGQVCKSNFQFFPNNDGLLACTNFDAANRIDFQVTYNGPNENQGLSPADCETEFVNLASSCGRGGEINQPWDFYFRVDPNIGQC